MTNNGNSGNLIHLLAAYRPVQFPQAWPGSRKLAEIAETIDHNCAATLRFANSMLRNMNVDGEELFSIAALRQEALALQKAWREIAGGLHHRPARGVDNSLVTLRSQYDTFKSLVRHFFFLLDRDLAGRIDGVL